MMELLWISFFIGLVAVAVVLMPFFMGEGGRLEDASSVDSIEKLAARQSAVLKRWVQESNGFKDGLITSREWKQRQVYLTNRYVDTTRRIDWLKQNRGAP